ncbi:N-acylneuraminate cytidylyltransferase [Allopseudospirillum japonicum]|uniref:N-acylneuraminate cytidylyltransferase n=1 Tax=Allopseudospirillum japonicum TaxID=64971 RepID=A0A1H6RBN0_9GAMM|nr:acylneuraminate cytidylyltransferase family protein [Allopseudospirillum japonicum]SEI50644.1 N-acylneuraminate cytidylyltransferase [Allopseudospirillum japonicum]
MSSIIAIIPARGGSKGVPKKNIRLLAGKPLLAHTLDICTCTPSITETLVTTDSTEIAQVAHEYGAQVIQRPQDLSGDLASSESALSHALNTYCQKHQRPDAVVFLQCTSPIRQKDDIQKAIDTFYKKNADSLLSVVPSHRFLWKKDHQGQAVSVNYDFNHRPRRQDMQPQYQENGSIYIFKPWVLEKLHNRLGGKIALYLMQESSLVDIDTEFDFKFAEFVLGYQS